MLANALLSLIEKVMNQLLTLDPELKQKLSNLDGRSLQIEIRDWQQTILCTYSGNHFHLYSSDEKAADCRISADIDTLTKLKDPSMLTQLIRQDKLDLEGDLNVAQGYSQAFSNLDIDWPEHFSHYIGDAAAAQLWLSVTTLKTTARQHQSKLATTLTSLCQDELAVTIHPIELAEFKQQTRQLKGQVAQLEQRINHLISAKS